MIREVAITIYLFIFKIFFTLLKLFPIKNKIAFVISFGDNSKYVYEEIRKKNLSYEVIILYKGTSNAYFAEYSELKTIPFETLNTINMIRAIYHLATSKFILVDNYFGFLSAITFKKEAECIQLWHASGALKKFGLEDKSITLRSKRAQNRFNKVYKNFHKIIVGSDVMADIFMRSFNLSETNLLKTGIPRTDFFYNTEQHKIIIGELLDENPEISNKKRILYAPTYRDNQLGDFRIALDLDQMVKELGEDHVLLLRLHPAVKSNINYTAYYPGFLYDYSSSKYDINELLLLSDYLITDYSSLPYEYTLLNKPIIFFPYDIEQYKEERGIIDNYENMVPGPVLKRTADIVEIIKSREFDNALLQEYSEKWNKYSKGNSSENLVLYMVNKDLTREKYITSEE